MLLFLICRNRLPNCSDDLSHWSDVFSWRQIHYKHLIKAYEGTASVGVKKVGVVRGACVGSYVNLFTCGSGIFTCGRGYVDVFTCGRGYVDLYLHVGGDLHVRGAMLMCLH